MVAQVWLAVAAVLFKQQPAFAQVAMAAMELTS
jgi:hypothetical protein